MALSKTSLQQGAQCLRMLWLKERSVNREFSDYEENEENDDRFTVGDIVGDAARYVFIDDPGSTVMIGCDGYDDRSYSNAYDATLNALVDPDVSCITEACFYDGDFVSFADIMRRNDYGSWDIYEVKSSRTIGAVHIRDASWQTYIARYLCGIDINDTYLMHPSSGTTVIANIRDLMFEATGANANATSCREINDNLSLIHEIMSGDNGNDNRRYNVDGLDVMLESLKGSFEIVDQFTPYIRRLVDGDVTLGDPVSWVNGMTIQEASNEMLEALAYDEVPSWNGISPGNEMFCHSPYECRYISACSSCLLQ